MSPCVAVPNRRGGDTRRLEPLLGHADHLCPLEHQNPIARPIHVRASRVSCFAARGTMKSWLGLRTSELLRDVNAIGDDLTHGRCDNCCDYRPLDADGMRQDH
jgi:hypothetical protein